MSLPEDALSGFGAQLQPDAEMPDSGQEIVRTSLTEETSNRLRAMITDQHLEPGSKLKEKDLCAQFGVSRTPLREAFKVLASEGLIEIHPNRGAAVAQVTVEETRETFEVLASLERLSGELAAQREKDLGMAEWRALHYTMVRQDSRGEREGDTKIVEAAGNSVLSQLHSTLNSRVRWARFTANLPSDRWAEAVAEHETILAAFEKRDGAALAAILHSHLMSKFEAIRHTIPAD